MSDTMLIGVLRMPLDTTDDITMEQFIDRARQAADRIESDADEITRLQADNEALRQQLGEILTAERKFAVNYGEAFVLRKQAEALEGCAADIKDRNRKEFKRWADPAIDHLEFYAQRLRDQAGEIERGGSE